MPETEKPEPKGVLAIWTSPDGDVIATAADFDRGGYGGFKLWEAQRMRARNSVMHRAVRAYCSDRVTDAIDTYIVEQIAGAMGKKGHKITCRAVGWPDDVAEEVKRR